MTNRGFQVAKMASLLLFTVSAWAASSVKIVDCDSGDKLADALAKAEPGATLRIQGTCTERVTIATDRITLQGDGTAVLDGGVVPGGSFSGVVRIEARGVVLNGLTIQNGPNGVIGQSGATFAVRNSKINDNRGTGIAVGDGSTAEVSDCTIRNNTLGMDAYNRSVVVFKGDVVLTQNKGTGIESNGGSSLEVRGGNLQASENGGSGILVSGSQLNLFGFAESLGSSIVVNGNGGGGLIIAEGQVLVVGTAFPPGSFQITASNNKMSGIWLAFKASVAAPFGTLKLVVEKNDVGLNFGAASGAVIVGGLNVRNNGVGLAAEDGATLTLVSIPPNPSVIRDNKTTDVDLRFGTRSTIAGVDIGTMKCDGTVLSRGSTVCP